MSQTMKEEAGSVESGSTQTLSIPNKSIETDINMSNIRYKMVKAGKINKYWNKVNYFTTGILNVHPPTHPEFLIGSVTQDRHHRVPQDLPASKWMMSLKSEADTIWFTTPKVIQMVTGPLMCRYNQNMSPFTKYRHIKSTFYTDTVCGKVPSLLCNKLSQVFTSGNLIFVAPMKSKADGGLGLIYTTEWRDKFPGFACWGDLILKKFKISFALSQNSQNKNANQDFCSTPRWPYHCVLETVF